MSITCDIVIKNATVIKGDGSPGFINDVGILDDKIAAVGKNLICNSETKIIDARGLLLSPGFIDIHTHQYMIYYVIKMKLHMQFLKLQ